MALTITLKAGTQFGEIEVPGCYVRVADVEVSKAEAGARVVFLKAAVGGILQESRYVFPYDIDGDNPIKQAYLHLKTLPDFEGAEDC